MVEDGLAAKRLQAHMEKVEDIPSIMRYGVMSTLGVLVDGKVVHAGGVPARALVESWFAA